MLHITVDALRGDLPGRCSHLFGDGGFRYLMNQGVHYTNAHYQHANTETIVGHVSLATGTVPAAHGMVGNVWFDRELIHTKGLEQAEVEEAVAEELVKFDGVAAAVSSTALRTASLPDTLLMRAILRNFHPDRSGDIYVVFDPNVFITDFDGLTVASTHGSPWRYDTFVPVMFTGAGLKARTVSRPITPYDVAPTLANVLGVKPPSGAIGNPLVEVVGH